MVGIELVKNRETREPLDEDLTKEFRQRMFERGVLVLRCGHWGNVIRLMPALTITRELLDKGVDIMIDTVKDIERKV
jgi:4-aminobutyrate aminotransferase-like enzyme